MDRIGTSLFRKMTLYGTILSLLTVSGLALGQDPAPEPPQNPPATTQAPQNQPPAEPSPQIQPPQKVEPGSPETQQPAEPTTEAPPNTPPTNEPPQGPPVSTVAPEPPAEPTPPSAPESPQAPPAAESTEQNPAQASPGWHRFNPQPPPPQSAPPQAPAPRSDPAPVVVPGRITIPAGTFVSVRVEQFLSSDKNKAGDSFAASLAKPLIANGLVVSHLGQTLGGSVVLAKKAGRVKGVSQLQITLKTLTLADGQQVPIETQLTNITGPTSNGRDAAAVGMTTVTGAAIGAAADWGPGAAIGGGAGLVAGLVGVLVTRGRPTVIYPESRLTFRLAKPVTFATDRAPQAFVAARPAPAQRSGMQNPPPAYRGGCAGANCPPPYPPPYYAAPPYPYYYPYWGPSFGLYWGPEFYGRGYFRR